MRRVAVSELKNQLSRWLRLVKRGETVEVLEHSVPIARIVSLRGQAGANDAALDRLVRDGLVSPARRAPDRKTLELPPVPCSGDAAAAVVDARGDR